MWKLRLTSVCLAIGGVSSLLALVSRLTGGAENTIFVLMFIAMVCAMASILSMIIFDTVLLRQKTEIEKKAVDGLAEDLRREIARVEEADENFPRSEIRVTTGDSRGFIISVFSRIDGGEYITMFVRVSLSYFFRHFALCVSYEEENVISYFHFFHRDALFSEMKREIGLLSGRFKKTV